MKARRRWTDERGNARPAARADRAATAHAADAPGARRQRFPDDGAVLLAALLVPQAATGDLPAAARLHPLDVPLGELLRGAVRPAVPATGAQHADRDRLGDRRAGVDVVDGGVRLRPPAVPRARRPVRRHPGDADAAVRRDADP